MAAPVYSAEVIPAPTKHNAQATLLNAVPDYGLQAEYSRGIDPFDLVKIQRSMKVAGATVGYTITAPSISAIEKVPITAIANGYFSCEAGYLSLAEEIASYGKPVITIQTSRHQGARSVMPANILRSHELAPYVLNAVTRKVQDEFSNDNFDIVGHSKGGIDGMIATQRAIQEDDGPTFRSMTFLASAGATNSTRRELILAVPRVQAEAGQALLKDSRHRNQMLLRGAIYGMSNPLRTVAEGIWVSGYQIDPNDLAKLSDNGVKTAGIFYIRDPFFPAMRADENIGGAVDSFVYGKPVQAGHLAPQIYPKETAQDYRTALSQLHLDRLTITAV